MFVLEGMVLILTCLLICYNPRDSTEDILIKTGTIMRQHHKPGEGGGGEPGSQAGDLEGTLGGIALLLMPLSLPVLLWLSLVAVASLLMPLWLPVLLWLRLLLWFAAAAVGNKFINLSNRTVFRS